MCIYLCRHHMKLCNVTDDKSGGIQTLERSNDMSSFTLLIFGILKLRII